MQLTGRTALVTGGSRGIGRAIAVALAEEGADVAVNYVSSETPAKQVVERILKLGRKAMLAQADVADFPDTFRMAQDVLKEFGHLDILINNAGINSDKTFVRMDHASWRKVLAINLDGVFNCTKVFIDQMLKQNYGRVVNITSVIGQIGNFGQANYAASKAGVAAFTKSLAKELAGKGITVNTVHGSQQSIAAVVRRFKPQVESMEGAAFMYSCQVHDVPFAQVRAVSNMVETRNREAWKMTEAIDHLAAAIVGARSKP